MRTDAPATDTARSTVATHTVCKAATATNATADTTRTGTVVVVGGRHTARGSRGRLRHVRVFHASDGHRFTCGGNMESSIGTAFGNGNSHSQPPADYNVSVSVGFRYALLYRKGKISQHPQHNFVLYFDSLPFYDRI